MRVAVYARVSTEHEAQINALENQLLCSIKTLARFVRQCVPKKILFCDDPGIGEIF